MDPKTKEAFGIATGATLLLIFVILMIVFLKDAGKSKAPFFADPISTQFMLQLTPKERTLFPEVYLPKFQTSAIILYNSLANGTASDSTVKAYKSAANYIAIVKDNIYKLAKGKKLI